MPWTSRRAIAQRTKGPDRPDAGGMGGEPEVQVLLGERGEVVSVLPDAGLADVADCMRELLSSKGEGRFVGERLREAAAAGRLRVRADAFFYAPFDFTALSEGLGRSSRRPL